MINTLNESSLHKSLKTLFSLDVDFKTEVKVENWICDIVTPSNDIIEIQNQNVSSLLPKILSLLLSGHKVTVVHPIITTKYIETYDSKGKRLSRRKSPSKENIYSIFRELTGLYTVLLKKGFYLKIIEITVVEKRIKTEKPVQLTNKSRRFRKDWIKTDKLLEEYGKAYTFNKKSHYLALFPSGMADEFCSKDLSNSLKLNKEILGKAYLQSNLMLWLYCKMGIIEKVYKKNRFWYYKIV